MPRREPQCGGFARGGSGLRSAWAAAAAVALTAALAQSATITVDTTADDLDVNGNCTLREAIQAANTNAPVDGCAAGGASPTVDEIDLPAGVYDLTLQVGPSIEDANQEGDLDVLEEVDIVGAGADLTAIDGQASERVLDFQVPTSTVLSTLTGVEVRNGSAVGGVGGGISLLGNLFVYSSRITGNTANSNAGGGINHTTSGYILSIFDSEVSNNHTNNNGGGILHSGLTEIYRSTVSGNSAGVSGGGIAGGQQLGPLRLYNTTVSGNTAGFRGGGVSEKVANLYNSTVYGNRAGDGQGEDLYNNGVLPANITLRNSIVAGAVAGTSCVSAGGAFTSEGHNFEGPGDSCNLAMASDSTNVPLADLGLTQLANFGGPTPVHGLFPESVAVDTAAATCQTEDQRGAARDDGLCDAGAFEVQAGEDVHVIFAGAGANFDDGTFGDWTVVGG